MKSDFVSSDHIPLCFDIAIDKPNVCTSPSVCSSGNDVPTFNWKDLTDTDLINYNLCTKEDLSRICIPLEALKCSDMSCRYCLVLSCRYVLKDIDCFYHDIANTVHGCVRKCIPVKKHSEHSIVG